MQAPLSPRTAIQTFLSALREPTRLTVAVSGGSDSTGLLFLIGDALECAPAGTSVTAVTVDHRLRPESAAEAEAVGALCRELGIAHRTVAWTGEKPTHGLPAAAREARYGLLADAATAAGSHIVLTGHTYDDQRETVAMRAQRSASADDIGLMGMSALTLYDRRVWIARPLLDCRRADIRDELIRAHIGWIDDPSNEDPRFERVRTRLALREAGDDAEPGLSLDHRRQLAISAADLIGRHAQAWGNAVVLLEPAALAAPPETLRRALEALLMILGGRRHAPGRDPVDRVMAFLDRGEPGKLTVGRCLLVRRSEGLYLMREKRGILPLSLPPQASDIWDGRFRVTNGTGREIVVRAAGQASQPPALDALPPSIARHAARILPEFVAAMEPEPDESLIASIGCELVLGGYDRFLAEPDRPLADAVATLFGRARYLTPPV
ncbi:tRNA lysidine(34) synthetase TilS [Pseudomonas sp. R2.Fl]|nr:tRNA lysidine(34) synthetase TilS [Pseudomonas sp. R2.Fl]